MSLSCIGSLTESLMPAELVVVTILGIVFLSFATYSSDGVNMFSPRGRCFDGEHLQRVSC